MAAVLARATAAALAVAASLLLALACPASDASGVEGSTVASPLPPAPAPPVAFVDVSVVPMDAERVLEHRTVLVRDGRIAEVGPAGGVTVPEGALRVDGRGKYLMPGLADLHVHLRMRGDLTLYLANGVTTVLNMGGFNGAQLRAWRDSARAGTMLGPELLVSYFLDGPGGRYGVLETVDDARQAVRQAKRDGYDFLKVYNSLSAEQMAAIGDEARRQGLAVIGHGVRSVGLERGFELGQVMVAHAEEYIYVDFLSNAGMTVPRYAAAASYTRGAGAYVTPNLSAYDAITRQWGNPAQLEAYLARPEARYLDPYWREMWRTSDYVTRPGTLGDRIDRLKRLTKELSDSGVPLLLGTDSPGIPGVFPGFSIDDDLRLMVEAGLTPYQALAAGTRTAGEFVARTVPDAEPFGTVAPGRRADLLLLDGNPLRALAPVARPAGVMLRGRWLPRSTLDGMLE
ncbi:MAG TPA: amidohydrolase family protein [Gemmatimonadaceae bacterium]|nr:amidohydrolase family protein [Gemmatimonadaceae bacterium]